MTLNGTETLQVIGVDGKGRPSGASETTTTQAIANLFASSTNPVSVGQGGAYVTDISSQLTPTSTGGAASNATIINNAILAASTGTINTVAITIPGTYYSNQIVMYSNTNLMLGENVILKKPPATAASMIINQGALLGSPASNTNIQIYGQGTIDGNVANQSGFTRPTNGVITTNTFLYGIQGEVAMISVNNFVFSLMNIVNCNGFCVQYTGKNGYFSGITVDTALDFLHINGPSSHIVIDRCTGFSTDAFIALNAWDWHISSPTVGDITDVHIKNCTYSGSNQGGRVGCLLALLPGTRSTGVGTGTGNVKNISMDGFYIDVSQGSVNTGGCGIEPSMAFDQVNGAEYSGVGLMENICLENGFCTIPTSGSNFLAFISNGITADGQATVTVRDFVLRNINIDATLAATGNSPILANTAFNFWYIEGFKVQDCEWTPAAASLAQQFINWGNKTPADNIIIDGLIINNNTASSTVAAFLSNQYSAGNASTINDLTLDRIQTAPNYQLGATPWFYVFGVVNNFRSRGNYIIGTGSGADTQGIQLNASTAKIAFGVVSDSYFSGVKEGLLVTNAVSSGKCVTIVFQNCQVVNQTHPIFINGAFNVDATHIGGSIDTGANLARVATGSLIASYSDTQSSGAGAATVTLVTAGTVELRKTDRIAISPTVVQTPANNDIVSFSGTPAYSGVNVISGTLAGTYIYRGTGTVGWIKLN